MKARPPIDPAPLLTALESKLQRLHLTPLSATQQQLTAQQKVLEERLAMRENGDRKGIEDMRLRGICVFAFFKMHFASAMRN